MMAVSWTLSLFQSILIIDLVVHQDHSHAVGDSPCFAYLHEPWSKQENNEAAAPLRESGQDTERDTLIVFRTVYLRHLEFGSLAWILLS